MSKKRPAATAEAAELKSFSPDRHNANKGTNRGRAMLEKSVRAYGMGRSILVDKNGIVIAGNKTLEAAGFAGLDRAVVVKTTGDEVIVVQRTDLDLETDTTAKELAIADNQAGAVGLAWDPTVLQALEKDGVEVGAFFRATEWAKITGSLDEDNLPEEIPEMTLQPFEEYNYLMVVCRNSQDWQGLCDQLGIRREKVMLGGTAKVGLGRVLDGSKLMEVLCRSTSSSPVAGARSSSATTRSGSSRPRRSASPKAKSTTTDA